MRLDEPPRRADTDLSMRLSGFSLLGILVALAIIALLCVHLFTKTSATSSQGPVGFYQNAVTQAQNSAAQQNAAATQAQTTLP